MVIITSHRGYHKNSEGEILENTIPAFKAAEELGVEVIELDVQITKDDKFVGHHDSKFNGGSYIADLTYDELAHEAKKIEFRIDLLSDIFKELPNIEFNVECKPKSFEVGEKLVKFIDDSKRSDTCFISSFSTETLKGCRNVSNEIRISQLDYTFLTNKWKKNHVKLNFYSINPNYSFVRKNLISRARKVDTEVHTWTCNKERIIKKMIRLGVDSIMTDYPNIALKFI